MASKKAVRLKGVAVCSLVPNYFIQAYDEYANRLRPVLALETHWHKTDEDLEAAVRKDAGVVVRVVFLTPKFQFLTKTNNKILNGQS